MPSPPLLLQLAPLLGEAANAGAAVQRRLLHGQAVDMLRDMILRGELAPGARLNERQLCERLAISRTPLREALRTLAAEGLVQLLPNRGAVVAVVDAAEIDELFHVTGALEALAGELACANASASDIAEITALHYQMRLHYTRGDLAAYFHCNQAIHQRIVDAARNGVLIDVYRKLSGRLRRARFTVNLSKARWARAMKEHDEILAALTERDGPRLRGLLAAHLRNKREALRQVETGRAPQRRRA
jgi:DNA-binding GntR family transcriptional regulator